MPNGDAMVSLQQSVEAVVRIVRRRLADYADYLGKNETATRRLVIDEVLSGLGWEVTKPELVLLEYGDRGSKVDYALMDGGRMVAVVEAKPCGEGLSGRNRRDAVGYADEFGVEYVILTNGARWEAWKSDPRVPREETVMVEVNIGSGDVEAVAADLMALHRDRLGDGE